MIDKLHDILTGFAKNIWTNADVYSYSEVLAAITATEAQIKALERERGGELRAKISELNVQWDEGLEAALAELDGANKGPGKEIEGDKNGLKRE